MTLLTPRGDGKMIVVYMYGYCLVVTCVYHLFSSADFRLQQRCCILRASAWRCGGEYRDLVSFAISILSVKNVVQCSTILLNPTFPNKYHTFADCLFEHGISPTITRL